MLSVVGLSHQSAPVELRERVAFADEELPGLLRALGHGVVLSTCNRTEIYRWADRESDPEPAERFLAQRLGVPDPDLSTHLYRLRDRAAVRHLFAVAAGLDSLVLGEAQILGQVRTALEAAEAAGTAGPVLSRIFQGALRAGRRARAQTFIGRHATSVSYAAVELARAHLGDLAECQALVVGAGEMGELTARTLARYGVGVVAVANRTFENAWALVGRVGGRAIGFEDLPAALREADIVITSTNAPGFVIDRPMVESALVSRGGRPLFVIDIAVPRDVDPEVGSIPGVRLYNIDDLRAQCDHNRERRRREIARVEAIIDAEVERTMAWLVARPAIPAIVALRDRAEEAREQELAEAMAKLRHLSAEDRAVVDQLTRALVRRLLHEPMLRLKALAASGDDEALRGLVKALGVEARARKPGIRAPSAR
jgi:glutamyl-tRNA reductase